MEVPCIAISRACCQEPQQVRGAKQTFEAVVQTRVLAQRNCTSDLQLALLLKFIDNHFAIAIIRIIYIYLHFITVYISLYLFTYLFPTALVHL